jgi:hypothetical protein
VRLEALGKLKKSTSSGTRTSDLPACSILPRAEERERQVGKSALDAASPARDQMPVLPLGLASRRSKSCFHFMITYSTVTKEKYKLTPIDRSISN